MSFSHTVSFQVATPSGTLVYSKSYTGAQSFEMDEATTTGTTNEEHDFTITVANILSVYLVSDQAVTLKFNSTGAPAPSIALLANVPYVSNTDFTTYLTSTLTTNITKVYVTNASGSTANWKFRFICSG